MRARLVLLCVLLSAPTALAGSGVYAGSWRLLPRAPIAPDAAVTSVWTGKEMVVSGVAVRRSESGAVLRSFNAAAAYNPSTNTWRTLTPPARPTDLVGAHTAVWTGREMLVLGAFSTLIFNPRTGQWRRLSRGHGGIVVWTGRELIAWGGGCCGDAFSDGVAYRPATNRWRKLPRSPLAGSQHPAGAWTGRELVIFVGGFDPDGKPWPARLARAAAYNPATDSWRRIEPLPAPRNGAIAVWDGREVLVVGGTGATRGESRPTAAVGFAYNPATNRWRQLPRMESGRIGAAAVWTRKRLLVWGGQTGRAGAAGYSLPTHGLAYDPKANRWSPLPAAPVLGRPDPTAVWTGWELIAWGGGEGYPRFTDGASFRPKGS